MKRKCLWIILLVFSFTAFLCFSEELDICISNGTGFNIYKLYISPSNEYGWGNDYLLPNDLEILNDGKTLCFQFENPKNYTLFDIMVVDNIGYEHRWFEVEIISGNNIILKYDSSTRNHYVSLKEGTLE